MCLQPVSDHPYSAPARGRRVLWHLRAFGRLVSRRDQNRPQVCPRGRNCPVLFLSPVWTLRVDDGQRHARVLEHVFVLAEQNLRQGYQAVL